MLPIIITCEHASNTIPDQFQNLGLPSKIITRNIANHIVYDYKAFEIASYVSSELAVPLFYGKQSRLVVDLNRSPLNPKCIVKNSFGVAIPGNENLTSADKSERIVEFHAPYFTAIRIQIANIIKDFGYCYLFSIHSFTDIIDASRNEIDIGIMHDNQNMLAQMMCHLLNKRCWRTYINRPYSGRDDGILAIFGREFESLHCIQIEFRSSLLDSLRFNNVCEDVTGVIQVLVEKAYK